jgi:hypothetical protein
MQAIANTTTSVAEVTPSPIDASANGRTASAAGLGWLVVLLGEGGDEGLGSGRVYQVMPDQRPGSEEVALAGAPRDRCVEAEAGNGEVEPEFGILLQEVGDLQAGEIRNHEVRLGRADLE